MTYPTGLVPSNLMMAQPYIMPAAMRLEPRDVPAEFSMWATTPQLIRQYHQDCVACAVCGAYQTQEDWAFQFWCNDGGHWIFDYNPAWLYGKYHETDKQDTGAQFGPMLSILKTGVVYVRDVPYTAGIWRNLPAKAYPRPGPREFYNVFAWGQKCDPAAIRRELSLGRPVLIGSWIDARCQRYKGGDLPAVVDQGDAHATFLYGYDGYGVYGQNSWGADWGDGGRYHMPWGVLERDVFEAWVMNMSGPVGGVEDVMAVAGATAYDQARGRG